MFFKTCEHYSNNELTSYKINNDKDNKECFICLDTQTRSQEIIQLRQIYIIEFVKNCNCDGYIHIDCLQKWCELHNKCPICRKNIEKRIAYINYIHVNKISYNFCLYKLILFIKVFSILYSILIFCEFIIYDKNNMNHY